MMAGRNISATHAAFTSARVMATCASIGQAAGTAAAMCVERRLVPRQLAADAGLLARLQQTLVRQDQSIRTVRNADSADLARSAQLMCSTEIAPAVARCVVDGVDRDIPANRATGAAAECHHWAAPITAGGAWIELSWDGPRTVREVVLKFDSGFQRELTLSASNTVSRGIVREPQPETVRDYTVSLTLADGSCKEVAKVAGNHQRLNRIRFDPVEATRVRLQIAKSNGVDEARVLEIRCH